MDVGRDPTTGKRLRHFESVRGNKKEAQRRLAELMFNINKGSYIKLTNLMLGDWLEDWIKGYVTTNCTARTLDSYQTEINNHITPMLGAIPLTELRPQHLQSYYAQALSQGRVDGKGGLSPRTVLYQHRILSEALNHAVKMGLLVRNVAEVVDTPHPKRTCMNTMASEDVPKFLKASRETPFHEIYGTALFTGMRLGELLGLHWCNVDLKTATLYVVQSLYKRRGICKMVETKTSHSRRSIALPPTLNNLLLQYRARQEAEKILLGLVLKKSDLLFAHPDGSPLDPGTVSKTFSKVLYMAGLPHIRFHDLRHTHATLMLKAGVHPKIVQERLGHGSIAVTLDTYSHVVSGLQETAAQRFEGTLDRGTLKLLVNPALPTKDVGKMWAKDGEFECEPRRTRTSNLLIKSQLRDKLLIAC